MPKQRTEFLEKWLAANFFQSLPMAAAIKDKDFEILRANREFEQKFGHWQEKKCYEVYQKKSRICPECIARQVLEQGCTKRLEENGYDRDENPISYFKYISPIKDDKNNISFLLEVITDITEFEQIRMENELLFDQVPCSILVIDKNFRIARINNRLRETLGDLEGKYCFQALKGLDSKCRECTARESFRDGNIHTGHHIWYTEDDRPLHFQIITAPLRQSSHEDDLIMEMAINVTDMLELQDELKVAHTFTNALITNSRHAILALNDKGEITIFNPACRKLFGIPEEKRQLTRKDLQYLLPEQILDKIDTGSEEINYNDIEINNWHGEKIPTRIAGQQLKIEGKYLGMALIIQDLQQIKQLEREKLEAERLAAVGQTVAGLAHGVKNLITSLEGGMYVLNSGFSQGDLNRLHTGLDMLNRNIYRISDFVKEFLNFSKGKNIQVQLNNPAAIAQEVISTYVDRSREKGIDIILESNDDIDPAAMDYESIYECLTNLISNAIDACSVSEDKNACRVLVRVFEQDDTIFYEVSDNGCGMDYDVKQKVFTNFFTTKGTGGTGLGLLTTKKTVQEHGGSIDMQSQPGEGSVFRIKFPRNRLPKLNQE